MDLATRLLQWRQSALAQRANAAGRHLPAAVSALLLLALAWQAARLTWSLVPGAPADAPLPAVDPAALQLRGPPAPAVDIARIVDSQLFGAATAEPEPAPAVSVLEAPDTTLDLRLKATVSDTIENRYGAAIISSGSVERTYTVTDIIEGAGGAQLHAIYGDRVILNRAGRLETLRLPTGYAAANTAAIYPAAPIAAIAARMPVTLRGIISDNAARLNEIVRIAPHVEQGRMVGFRLFPGESPERFASIGLRPGDVVTEINGTAMSDPNRGLQVFERLGESTSANVTVIRNGAPQVLTIDTAQLSELGPPP